MNRKPRARIWIELVASAISLALLVITFVSNAWIEVVFHVDPDHGSGFVEWLIVAASALITLALVAGAGYEWRRAGRAIGADHVS